MRAILVGAGGTARELVKRLGDRWEIVAVDVSAESSERLRQLRPIEFHQGDGSSRVVLQRAGLETAEAVVAATNDDDVNLEVVRLAKGAGIHRIAAVVVDPGRVDEYLAEEIHTVSPARLAAQRIELGLDTRRMTSFSFAHGRAEAIEFRIAHDSPVRGKALRDLHARSWIVGAILRGDHLVVPHGDTRLETDDLVTVVGAGADFAEIVRTFTAGEPRFPLDFGKRVALALTGEADLDPAVPEAVDLVRNTRASALVLVYRDPDSMRDEDAAARVRDLRDRAAGMIEGVDLHLQPVREHPRSALRHLPAELSVGILVVGAPSGKGVRVWRAVRRALNLVRVTQRPVLVARGRHPYRRVLAPARRTPGGRAAIRVALDLARAYRANFQGLAVVDPLFAASTGSAEEARSALAWVEEDASVLGVEMNGRLRRGNPVRSFLEEGSETDCTVLAAGRGSWKPSGRVRITSLVAQRTRGSALLVPVRDGE